jgi:Chlorophyllase
MVVFTLRQSIAFVCFTGLAAAACSSSDTPSTEGNGKAGTTLESCDLRTESSTNPATQACGSLTSPLGKDIKLGQYGAVMELNVGAGFENTVNGNDSPGNTYCSGFANGFAEDPKLTTQLLDVGNIDFALYTLYRPANWPDGKVPVLSWGNGTCAQPEGYGTLLRYIASQGFVIIAANSRFVGTGTEIKHGLDFAAAANDDPKSSLHGHLDLDKMGVMGHSQGSAGALLASGDDRVTAAILFNGGNSIAKPFMAVSGEFDIGGTTAATMQTALDGATEGSYLYFHNPYGQGQFRGHLVLMMTPERLTDAAAGFWQLVFRNDSEAQKLFVGESCGLCGKSADFDFGEKGL